MKFSLVAVLAMAAVAIAAPTYDNDGDYGDRDEHGDHGGDVEHGDHGGHGGRCNYWVCTDDELLAIDLDINVLGILGIDLDIELLHHHRCKQGKHIPDTCHRKY
ncbi:uncharacterized protein MAM_07138 [Metarhizium album ARSEF 1941]|uniref:Hydrophobin n=1 Tax=Metarhizium album (strain ARSEF 1941) TaxID=1081103 RepID=A0A0B2WG05_METAS|nr:uncharacterized protein MAM_07138 [Metarhizium album ARSEF 1941]KHN94911.1 hypothetical protein MAM_07138 [Metarhizium album ARSEF 1941]